MQMQIVYEVQMQNVNANCKCNMYARRVQIANLENLGKAGSFLQNWKKVEKIGKKWKSGNGWLVTANSELVNTN